MLNSASLLCQSSRVVVGLGHSTVYSLGGTVAPLEDAYDGWELKVLPSATRADGSSAYKSNRLTDAIDLCGHAGYGWRRRR